MKRFVFIGSAPVPNPTLPSCEYEYSRETYMISLQRQSRNRRCSGRRAYRQSLAVICVT